MLAAALADVDALARLVGTRAGAGAEVLAWGGGADAGEDELAGAGGSPQARSRSRSKSGAENRERRVTPLPCHDPWPASRLSAGAAPGYSQAVKHLGPLLSLLLLVGCGASLPASQPHALLDKSPEAIEQVSLAGEMVKFPEKGKVTVLDFWSTSCEPCIKMMPALQSLHSERKAQGLAMVGVAIDDNPGLVQERLKKLGVTYVNVIDDSGSTIRGAYQVSDLPQTFIFDKKGQLRVVTKGGDDGEVAAIQDAVSFLLAE